MVDEDFVMGYVCGFNDGVQSGGGGGVPTGDTVIYNDVTVAKKWNLSGTPFSIALFDLHSDRLMCGTQGTHVIESGYEWDSLMVYYWLSMGLLYNNDIVTVNPLYAVGEASVHNGLPGRTTYATRIISVGGSAAVGHSVSGTAHNFYVNIRPSYTYNQKEYRQGKLVSETEKTAERTALSVLSWKLIVDDNGGKTISSYDPYWFFSPSASSNATYSKRGTMGIPKGTSMQQLLQTGLLFDTLKESLLVLGENVTLEEV